MTLQIVFLNHVESTVVDRIIHFAPRGTRTYSIIEKDTEEQLYSPRWKHMIDVEKCPKIKDCQVLYVGNPSEYTDIYDFVFKCRPKSNNKNLFLLRTKEDIGTMTWEELLATSKVYIPVSGERLPINMPPEHRAFVRAYLLQACHILTLWKERNLLEGKKTIVNINGTLVELDSSKGEHRALDKNDGWIFNVSTFVIAMLIDHYQIEGELPNAQLNFSNDAEYRYKVATYLYNVLKAFAISNGATNTSTLDDIVKSIFIILG
jgi:hypothetical protein